MDRQQKPNSKAYCGRAVVQYVMAVAAITVAGAAWAQPAAAQLEAPAGKPRSAKAAAAESTATEDKSATGKAAAPRTVQTPVCSGEIGPAVRLKVAEGKSTLLDLPQLNLPAPAWLRLVGDTELVQIEPFTSSTPRNMFFVFGKKIGSTNLMFQNKEGRCAMVEVSIGVDTAAVQSSLLELMPMEKGIRVSSAADSLVISGMVSDATVVDRIMNVATAFVRKSGGAAGSAGKASERIVNMMSVGAPQQVMLEVKVAEISKSLVDTLGTNLSTVGAKGNWALGLLSAFPSSGNGGVRLDKNGGKDFLHIDAERKNGIVKILAEPTVMAISGQEGSFLAGGRIFIPVSQDANGKVTLEEKEFGVGLRFTPTVLDGGRINLKVAPEVSELAREGVGISSGGAGAGAVLPLITTRRAATTVQLFDGQSFVIGGLLKHNVTQNIKALPGIGEVPVLGALFRSSDFQNDRTELVFIVTPRLVKPLPAVYPLPTDGFVEPTREEFFLKGKMEGQPAPSARTVEKGSAPVVEQAAAPTGFELK